MDKNTWNHIRESVLVYYLNGRKAREPMTAYIRNLFGQDLLFALQKAISSGYIRVSTFEEQIRQITINDLREVLRKHNLPDTGNKDALMKRVKEKVPVNDYRSLCCPVYIATEKGTKLIHDNYIYISERYFLNEQRAERISAEIRKLGCDATEKSYFKVNMNLLLEDGAEYMKEKKWGLLALNYSDLAYLIINFGTRSRANLQQALTFLSMSLAMALTGMEDEKNIADLHKVEIDGGKIKTLNSLIGELGFTEEDFSRSFLQSADHILPLVPFSYFTKNKMLEILNDFRASSTGGLLSCMKYKNEAATPKILE